MNTAPFVDLDPFCISRHSLNTGAISLTWILFAVRGATDASRLVDDFAGTNVLRSELCKSTRRAIEALEGINKSSRGGGGSGNGGVLPTAVVRKTALDRLRRFVLLFGIVHDSDEVHEADKGKEAKKDKAAKGEHDGDLVLDANDDNNGKDAQQEEDGEDGHHTAGAAAAAAIKDLDYDDEVIDICGTTSPMPTSGSGSGSGSRAPAAGDKDKTAAGGRKKESKVKWDSSHDSASSKPLTKAAGQRKPSEAKVVKSMEGGQDVARPPKPRLPRAC